MFAKIKALLFAQTAKDTLISFTGLGTIAVAGMVFSIITARGLGPSLFGIFSALNALVTLLSSLGDLGISSALVNFIPKVKDNRNVLISVTFWFQLAVTLTLTLALMAAGLFNRYLIPGSTTTQFIIIGILTGFYVLQGFALGIFNAERKFFQASFIQAMDSIVKLSIVAGLFFNQQLNIEVALIANVISCGLSLVYGFSGEMTEIFKFSKWIALSRAFSVTISRIDIILLNILSGSFQTGIYSAAARIALLFALLVSSLSSVVAPRFSAFRKNEEMLGYLKKVAAMIGGISVLMLFTVVIADPLVPWVFGDEYLPAIPVFRALAIAMIPFLLNVVTTQPLIYYFNKPQIFARITILQVIIIVSLDLLLIPRFQAIAPAISMGVSNLVVLVITGWQLSRLLK